MKFEFSFVSRKSYNMLLNLKRQEQFGFYSEKVSKLKENSNYFSNILSHAFNIQRAGKYIVFLGMVQEKPVIVSISEIKKTLSKTTIEFELYDLNTSATHVKACLYAIMTPGQIYISDIQCTPHIGHGSLLMGLLFDYCKKHGIQEITGRLSFVDINDHAERLYSFYKKFGFEIFDVDNSIEKNIKLIL